jgi:hypothetical protein
VSLALSGGMCEHGSESESMFWMLDAEQMMSVALHNIEPLGSGIVGGKSKEVSLILGSFPHEKSTKWFNN